MSLIDTGLGDRIVLEAPLRLHKSNRPRDRFIAILDKRDGVDLPYCLRRHFDELWWITAGNGQRWMPSPRTAVARRVRDALLAARVHEVYVASWLPTQFPRNSAYTLRGYHCIHECNYLRDLQFFPQVVVTRANKRWAAEFIRANIPDRYEAFISVHLRRYARLSEKNLDAGLIQPIFDCLRRRRRFAFLLIGRDDARPEVSAPDVFSFVGLDWSFEQTAALIARTRLFIGADSGPTHAAAGLGVPVIAFGCYGPRVGPITHPNRYVYFQKGDSPQTILAEVARFVKRLRL